MKIRWQRKTEVAALSPGSRPGMNLIDTAEMRR